MDEHLGRLFPRPRRRANPLLAMWRLRWEAATVLTAGGLAWLAARTSWIVPAGMLAACGAGLLVTPTARDYLAGLGRSVVAQHRLRAAFYELGLTTWRGRLPTILWSSPRPAGIRVVVLVPAGISANDLRIVSEALAAACFVQYVDVDRHPRWANVVVLFLGTRPRVIRTLGPRLRDV